MKGCRLGEMKGCLRRGRLFGRDIALLGKINPIKAYLKIKKKKRDRSPFNHQPSDADTDSSPSVYS